jgi:hypothetical protein
VPIERHPPARIERLRRQAVPRTGAIYKTFLMNTMAMNVLVFASAVAPKGLPVILPGLAGAGILIFLSQLFVPKTS